MTPLAAPHAPAASGSDRMPSARNPNTTSTEPKTTSDQRTWWMSGYQMLN